MESAEMISPPTAFANWMDNAVFPTAVGPVKIINGFFSPVIDYTILLNFFSNSYLLMEIMVGLP